MKRTVASEKSDFWLEEFERLTKQHIDSFTGMDNLTLHGFGIARSEYFQRAIKERDRNRDRLLEDQADES